MNSRHVAAAACPPENMEAVIPRLQPLPAASLSCRRRRRHMFGRGRLFLGSCLRASWEGLSHTAEGFSSASGCCRLAHRRLHHFSFQLSASCMYSSMLPTGG